MSFLSRLRAVGWRRWLFIGLGLVGALFLFLVGAVIYYRATLPTIYSLADYQPPQVTRIFSDDGHLVGELFAERRTVVPTSELPQHVTRAFLAAEDARFYEHEGLDYFGMLRAFLKNLRPGAHLQGASTITQQVVKTMVVGPERSYGRKAREILLSRQLEEFLSKDDILHLYLNQIYFGSGVYGIEAAAQIYFGKAARDLDVGEAAYLACAPKNPSRYTILDDPAALKERQRYVLEQMAANTWITPADAERETREPVPGPPTNRPYLGKAPHYVEHVRNLLVEAYGEERVTTGGLTVYTGMHADAQAAAHQAVQLGLEELARQQGWPGARLRIEVDKLDSSMRELREAYDKQVARQQAYSGVSKKHRPWLWDLSAVGEKSLARPALLRGALEVVGLTDFTRVTGVVTDIDSAGKQVWIDLGCCIGHVPLSRLQWAKPLGAERGGAPLDPSQILSRGDLVAVDIGELPSTLPTHKPKGGEARPLLEVDIVPVPKVNGALVAIDPNSRLVRAMVGGYDSVAGQLNRAIQARRQPGSSFKPIVYAAGIAERAITPASLCPDSPVVIHDQYTGKAWKPENYEDGKYDGNITYRTALSRSKNTCSVKLVERITPEKVISSALALGIKSELPKNLTIALGTGEVFPIELANAYATIAAGGLVAEPIFVRKVVAPDGTVLEERRAELVAAIDPGVAFVVTRMMRSVIEEGTATKAMVLERPLAGKTGTTNQARSIWFSGFSQELVATVYVGFDDNRPMGMATGGGAALPIWIRFMGRALTGVPVRDEVVPEDVVTLKIDKSTGVASDLPEAFEEVFLAGTEPVGSNEKLPSIFDVE